MAMIALGQFEDLIRDSEKIRILEELAKRSNGKGVSEKDVSAVIGYEIEGRARDEPDMLSKENRGPLPTRKKVDHGKVIALHNAGWINKAIAEEMNCSESTVSTIINSETVKNKEEK